jgi:hypothetical protein
MRFRPPLRASVTRREEKQQKLRDFVIDRIPGARADCGPARELLLIARSVDSPVVKAIAGLAREIASNGLSVRMIVARADKETLPQGWSFADPAAAFHHEIRWARNPRLLEAHEQLVLGTETCWIGDSMRRDPSKCDAFENYVDACPQTANSAAVSFERLWSVSEPLRIEGSRPHGEAGSHGQPTFDAATRH